MIYKNTSICVEDNLYHHNYLFVNKNISIGIKNMLFRYNFLIIKTNYIDDNNDEHTIITNFSPDTSVCYHVEATIHEYMRDRTLPLKNMSILVISNLDFFNIINFLDVLLMRIFETGICGKVSQIKIDLSNHVQIEYDEIVSNLEFFRAFSYKLCKTNICLLYSNINEDVITKIPHYLCKSKHITSTIP
jgi:hypothetical protein